MKKLLALLLVFVAVNLVSAETIINVDPSSNFSHTKVLGVREEAGELSGGVVADLAVEVREGSGNVYIDTIPLTKIDTQASARLAKEVACEILDHDCSRIDFLYTLRSPYVIIGGPSAGAALTAATMAALQGEELNSDVIITGTINPAVSISHVGGIYEKIKAVDSEETDIVLIPFGQEIMTLEDEERTISIITEARKQWDLKVIPVEDITDAYKYLTGLQINRSEIYSSGVSSEKLDNALKKLSEGLLPEAEESYQEAKSALKTTTISEKDQIESLLETSANEFERANSTFEQGLYYSSSSFAVRSSIYSYYANRLMEFYKTENASYVESEIDRIANAVADFEILFLRNNTVDSIDDVEVFAVVIDRIRESEDIINESRKAYNQSDYDSALYLISYAEVRKNTAYQWLTLINEFEGNETFVFDPSKVQDLALQRIEQSRNAIVYAQIVSGSALLENAEDLLQESEEAYLKKKYIFSVFEASKARATANLALEVRSLSNETVDAKIQNLEEEALRSIQKAEDLGLTPILALSYLEFAKNFYEADQDQAQALIYLSYSKEMAQISEEITKAVLEEHFAPEKEPEVERYYEEIVRMDVKGSIIEAIILLITGMAAGALAVLAYQDVRQRR